MKIWDDDDCEPFSLIEPDGPIYYDEEYPVRSNIVPVPVVEPATMAMFRMVIEEPPVVEAQPVNNVNTVTVYKK